jgi:hypothetical protein
VRQERGDSLILAARIQPRRVDDALCCGKSAQNLRAHKTPGTIIFFIKLHRA